MKSEDIVIGKEYFVDLSHENAYYAFSDDVDRAEVQVVKVVDTDETLCNFDYTVAMQNVEYFQVIGLSCFIKPV